MSIDKLYDLLEKKDFLNPDTANIFSPFYFYTYNAKDEYSVRLEIERLKGKLERPLAMVDTLVLNLYEVLIEFLQSSTVAGKSQFDIILDREKRDEEKARVQIERMVSSEEFCTFLVEKIKSHLSEDSHLKKVYVFLYGVGSVYPYLRVHNLISRLEQFVKDYKMIIFYPGKLLDNNYQLFERLPSKNIYRANHLNEFIS